MAKNVYTIGRSRSCHIRVADKSVSGVHAAITLLGNSRYKIQDKKSTNGTFLQKLGKWIPITNVEISGRDRIRLGTYEVILGDLVSDITDFTQESGRDNKASSIVELPTAKERRLAAVLIMDVVNYSRMMGENEVETLEHMESAFRDIVQPRLREFHGRFVNSAGDSLMAEFKSANDAVASALEIQAAMAERNTHLAEEHHIKFRIGINLGDVLSSGGAIFGDGVNVAARLESIAEPGAVYVSGIIRDVVKNKSKFKFRHVGDKNLKNIVDTVRVYEATTAGE